MAWITGLQLRIGGWNGVKDHVFMFFGGDDPSPMDPSDKKINSKPILMPGWKQLNWEINQ